MAEEFLLRALFDWVPRDNREAIIQQLPEDLKKRCRDAEALQVKDLEELFPDPMRLLGKIHQSWYEEVLSFSPQSMKNRLQELFSGKFGPLDKERTPLADFLIQYVVHNWPDRDKLPLEALNDHPFSWLLHEDENGFENLAGLLAVHDMVDVVKKIIDKKCLHQVLELISPQQQKYLRALLHRKGEGASLRGSGADLLKMSSEEAKYILRERGYNQLCILLSGQDDFFYWHLFHRLERNFALQMQERIMKHERLQECAVFEKRLNSVYQFLHKGEGT